ncbi:MAG: Hint domain-containing protein [Patescibacteria group bacterium]|nr:Hint domain-containing protein [Patescibacteria group bacterium]
MKIAMVGCGKLGWPVAVAYGLKHDVTGYDVAGKVPSSTLDEGGLVGEDFLQVCNRSTAHLVPTLAEAVVEAEIVFVAVQTPHEPRFEGITPLPEDRADFDYTYLKQVVADLVPLLQGPQQTLAVISTVLPGTMRWDILPLLEGTNIELVYCPHFPAMGTVLEDLMNAEFVLLGAESVEAMEKVASFYQGLFGDQVPILKMSIESAELGKVAYNVAISTKVVMSSVLSEMCHKIPGCDVDRISDVWEHATKRISSKRYLRGGFPEGGPCFTADTLVITKNGRRSIADIEIGDLVLTQDGTFAPVIKRWETAYTGDVYKIRVKGSQFCAWATPTHPFFAAKDWQFKISDKLEGIIQVEAQDLSENYYVVFPIAQRIIDGSWYVSHDCCDVVTNGNRMKKVVECERVKFSGEFVYNLWINHPSHSYVTTAGLVGNCHPRDGIAMSWLARKLDLSYDLFGSMMEAREKQCQWLVDLFLHHGKDLPKIILGTAYKSESSLDTGSAALLCWNLLKAKDAALDVSLYDPYSRIVVWEGDNVEQKIQESAAAYLVGCKHDHFRSLKFAKGSVVIDPFRFIPQQDGVKVISVGIGEETSSTTRYKACGL